MVQGCIVTKLRILSVSTFLILAFCLAHGQEYTDVVFRVLPNQDVRINDLRPLVSPSIDNAAVLQTALETVLNDGAKCCGKGSRFENVVLAEPRSLKDLNTALQDGHFWSDHTPKVHVNYLGQCPIEPGVIIAALLEHHASILEWKSHFYVVYGVIFDEAVHYSGRRQFEVHKFLLLDPRFSDSRKEVVFNRDADDWGEIQGVLTLTVDPN
jgi:hypothetical protein